VTCHAYRIEIEGLLTQGSRPGRTVGEAVGGILDMDSSDWSNGIQYHIIDTRPDTEFKTTASYDVASTGCHSTSETRVQHALGDVASNVCQARP